MNYSQQCNANLNRQETWTLLFIKISGGFMFNFFSSNLYFCTVLCFYYKISTELESKSTPQTQNPVPFWFQELQKLSWKQLSGSEMRRSMRRLGDQILTGGSTFLLLVEEISSRSRGAKNELNEGSWQRESTPSYNSKHLPTDLIDCLLAEVKKISFCLF